MAVADLTVAYLRQVLDYDPLTGNFTWRHHRHPSRVGLQVGSINSQGYVRIVMEGVAFVAHRLAWLHVHGRWPRFWIDHVNGDRADNRLCNLRDVVPMVNAQNRRLPGKSNRSGFLGVCRSKKPGVWESKILLAGHRFQLGEFTDPAEAAAAYLKAKRKLHKGCTI